MQQIIITRNFSKPSNYSEIKPLFKEGDKSDISNYRPISLLTSFSKILERAMSIQLLERLNNNNILMEVQFGFRTESSTDVAIYKLLNEIQKAPNSKNLIVYLICFQSCIFSYLERT
jgi:retron-type reverse transcriptase